MVGVEVEVKIEVKIGAEKRVFEIAAFAANFVRL